MDKSISQLKETEKLSGEEYLLVAYPDETNKKVKVKNITTGKDGIDGANGRDGQSAYQVALDNGFEGTEEQWLQSLRGPQGIKGDKGEQGIQGAQGKQGPQGIAGKDGEKGDTGIGSRTVMVFKHSDVIPQTPQGGSWNPITGDIIYPEGWIPSDKNIQRPIWMSNGEFLSITPDKPTWSTPVCISGEDGTNGADGLTTEFIYKLWPNTFTAPGKPTQNTPTDEAPEGWTDNPSGISAELPVEYCCTRKRKNNIWGHWSEPFIWAKWGENGMDGDGVEYIYYRNNGQALNNPTPNVGGKWYIDTDEYQERGIYTGKEYIPDGWTDNPNGVDYNNVYEWVCQRKRRKGPKDPSGNLIPGFENKVMWGAFSNPSVWAKFGRNGLPGENGISERTMYAKTSGSSVKPKYNPNNVNPGSIWGFTVPNRSNSEAIWSIRAYIDYRGELVAVEGVKGWYGLTLITGIDGKDSTANYKLYVYKLSDDKPNQPTWNNPESPIVEEGWVDVPSGIGNWWQCVGEVNGVSHLVEKWSEVVPLNGKPGVDGTYVEFRFKVSAEPILTLTPEEKNNPEPVGWLLTIPPLEGKNLFMIQAIKKQTPDGKGELQTPWSDPAKINGEQGPIGETGPAGPPGPNGLVGIPGVDMVHLYCLGTDKVINKTTKWSEALRYNLPEDMKNNNGWSAVAPTIPPSGDYLYIWCISCRIVTIRNPKYTPDGTDPEFIEKNENGWCDPFRMTGINGADGVGVSIAGVDEYYKYSDKTTGVENTESGWSKNEYPGIPLDSKFKYLWNFEQTFYDDGTYGERTKPVLIGNIARDGLDGTSSVSIDLSNENDTVAVSNTGYASTQIPLTTTVSMWYGADKLTLDNATPTGMSFANPVHRGNGIFEMTIPINQVIPEKDNLTITASAKVNGTLVTKDIVYSFSSVRAGKNGESPIIYSVKPNYNVVLKDKLGVLTPTKITADKLQTIGGNTSSTPYGKLWYTKDDDTQELDFLNGVNTNTFKKNIKLIYRDSSGKLLDSETIPIIKDGIDARFKSTVFKRTNVDISQIRPTGGSFGSPLPDPQNGWSDGIPSGKEILWASTREFYPEGSGVDTVWSLPVQMVNTSDFEAIYTAMELSDAGNPTEHPNENANWSSIPISDALYMATSSMSNGNWADWQIARIKGEKGKDGNGIKSIEDRYYTSKNGITAPGQDWPQWEIYPPETTVEKQYLWNWTRVTYTEGGVQNTKRVIGTHGATGDRGQLVYPAGIYNTDGVYITDTQKAPYVRDTSDNNYYVLNTIGTWNAKLQNQTPSQNYNSGQKDWIPFQSFDAIYADIGILKSALVGSSVFNGQFMFSQQGINKEGHASSKYEGFCGAYKKGNNGLFPSNADPMDAANEFRPNYCVDFSTGKMWANNAIIKGEITFSGTLPQEVSSAQLAATDAFLAASQASTDASTAKDNTIKAAQSARDASNFASTAQNEAKQAALDALAAKGHASNANNSALAAQQSADDADRRATTAESTANTASNTATDAKTKAQAAYNKALATETDVTNNVKPRVTKINDEGIYTGTLDAGLITTGVLGSDVVYSGSIYADQITAGTIDASNIEVTNINADNITSGSITNGNHWNLGRNGNGYLANKNITWDTTGVLTVKSLTSPNDYFNITADGKMKVTSGEIGKLVIDEFGINAISSGGEYDKSRIYLANTDQTNYIKLEAANNQLTQICKINADFANGIYVSCGDKYQAASFIQGYNPNPGYVTGHALSAFGNINLQTRDEKERVLIGGLTLETSSDGGRGATVICRNGPDFELDLKQYEGNIGRILFLKNLAKNFKVKVGSYPIVWKDNWYGSNSGTNTTVTYANKAVTLIYIGNYWLEF